MHSRWKSVQESSINPLPVREVFFVEGAVMAAEDQEQPAAMIQIMNEAAVKRSVARMAAEIVENDGEDVMLVGIHTRGVPLADRLADRLEELSGSRPVVGRLDITLYRDDIGPWLPAHTQPVLRETVLPISIDDVVVYLVDDVLYTGRTTRAALDTLIDWGRPKAIRLAVLIDRGHRELPVAANVIGRVVATSRREDVQVRLRPADDRDGVWLGREVPDGG
jgi:pyrimidine operon attenuation protein/uracil phosphoribosyltransferase